MSQIAPVIKAFLIADKVLQEKNTNKWCAIGIFDRIYAPQFPCIHTNLALYIRLGDAQGKYKVKIEFCDSADRVLAKFENIEIDIPSRLACPDFGINTTNLLIPAPGKYCFKLYFNDLIAQLFDLDVAVFPSRKEP